VTRVAVITIAEEPPSITTGVAVSTDSEKFQSNSFVHRIHSRPLCDI
jgi:hypothetical protein